MKPPVRLDSVVRVKEREEERALKRLADAQNVAQKARADAEAAQKRVFEEGREAGRVDFWELAEHATDRSRYELKKAAERSSQADHDVLQARAGHLVARNKAEAVRRVAANRRAEWVNATEKKETQRLDELAAIRFWHRGE